MSVLEPDISTSCYYYFMIMEKDKVPMRFKQIPLEIITRSPRAASCQLLTKASHSNVTAIFSS